MKEFEHILITRFNLGYEQLTKNPEKWMEERMVLFEEYCLPSVKAQTSNNFRWIVFFDDNTAQKHRQKIKEIEKDFKNLEVVYLKKDIRKDKVNDMVRKNTQYLITTRIDNDDAIANDFVERIQMEYKEQKFEFVNLKKGYVYSEKNNPVLRTLHTIGIFDSTTTIRTHQKSNPFISLIEKRAEGRFKTVLLDEHLKLGKYGRILQVSDKYYWLQVIHKDNLINQNNLRIHYLMFNFIYRLLEGKRINKNRFKTKIKLRK